MPVQYGRAGLATQPGERADAGDVGKPRIAGDRPAVEAERQPGRERGEGRLRRVAADRGIAEEPDRVPAGELGFGEVEDVAEQPAERRAEHVQDAQRLREGHVATPVPWQRRERRRRPTASALRL